MFKLTVAVIALVLCVLGMVAIEAQQPQAPKTLPYYVEPLKVLPQKQITETLLYPLGGEDPEGKARMIRVTQEGFVRLSDADIERIAKRTVELWKESNPIHVWYGPRSPLNMPIISAEPTALPAGINNLADITPKETK